MNTTATNAMDCAWFFGQLASAQTRILMVDYDKAMAPVHTGSHDVQSYAQIAEFLRCIITSCHTRVIVVSGCGAREISPLLDRVHPFEVWERNGLEKIDSLGCYREVLVSETALGILAEAESRLERAGLGSHLDVTLAGVTLRWKGESPADIQDIKTKAYEILQPLAASPEVRLEEFAEGIEIRLASANIGSRLRDFLSKVEAGVPVAYLGDDPADEEAFDIVNSRGLSVLVTPQERLTAAQMSLKPPQLARFLSQWIQACGANG